MVRAAIANTIRATTTWTTRPERGNQRPSSPGPPSRHRYGSTERMARISKRQQHAKDEGIAPLQHLLHPQEEPRRARPK